MKNMVNGGGAQIHACSGTSATSTVVVKRRRAADDDKSILARQRSAGGVCFGVHRRALVRKASKVPKCSSRFSRVRYGNLV
jgi:hypothetical protein